MILQASAILAGGVGKQGGSRVDTNQVAVAPSKPKSAPDNSQGKQDAQRHLSSLLQALQAVRGGDFSVRLPPDQVGLPGKIADTFNDIVLANQRMARELEQVGQVVGREGRARKRVRLGVTAGAWGEMEGSVN